MTETMTAPSDTVFDEVRGHRDALAVGRVFGDAYEIDGMTVIPVGRVAGGGGGGAGEDSSTDGETDKGFGTGFGLSARGSASTRCATARSPGNLPWIRRRSPRAARFWPASSPSA